MSLDDTAVLNLVPPYCILGCEEITDVKTVLAFDEYRRFYTSAFFMRIKRALLYTHKESRSIKTAIFIES
jgi:hypothetical protein